MPAPDSAAESQASQTSRSSPSQNFVYQEGDEETLWEVIAITAEKGTRYKVRWKGIDPATMKPWPQSWVVKTDCTDDLVREWKRKQRLKAKSGRTATTLKKTRPDSAASKLDQSVTSNSKSTRRSTSTATTKPAPEQGRSSAATTRTTATATPTATRTLIRDREISNGDVDELEEEPLHISKPRPSGFSKPKSKKRKLDEATSAHSSAKHLSGGDPVNKGDRATQRAGDRPRKKRKVVVEVVKQEHESGSESRHSVVQPQSEIHEDQDVAAASGGDNEEEEEEKIVESVLSEPDGSPPPDESAYVPENDDMEYDPPLPSPTSSAKGKGKEDYPPLYRSSSPPIPLASPSPPPAVKIGPPKKIAYRQSAEKDLSEKLKAVSPRAQEVPVATPEKPPPISLPSEPASARASERQPTEERSVFWDGGAAAGEQIHEPILSPSARKRLEQFDEEVMGVPRKRRVSQPLLSDEGQAGQAGAVSEPWFRPNEASSLIRASSSKSITKPVEPLPSEVIQVLQMTATTSNGAPADAQVSKPKPRSTSPPHKATALQSGPLPRRSANPPTNSFTTDVVPETDQSQSQSQEQLPPPPAAKADVNTNTKRRTPEQPGPTKQRPLGPIPQLSPSTFHPHLPPSSLPESITNISDESHRLPISEDDDPEGPMSSIEQFDSPVKAPKSSLVLSYPVDRKGKGKAKESASDIWGTDVVQRGLAIAEAARKKRGESPSMRAPKKTVDDIIAHTRSRSVSGSSFSSIGPEGLPLPVPIDEDVDEDEQIDEDMAGASTAAIPPTSGPPAAQHSEIERTTLEQMENAYVDLSGGAEETQADITVDELLHTVDPILLRQEEEESTQDVMMELEHVRVERPAPLPTWGVRPTDILPPIDEGDSFDPNTYGDKPDGGNNSDTSLKAPQIMVQQPSRATSVQSYSADEDHLPVGRITRSRSRSKTPAVANRPIGKEKKAKSSAPSSKRGSVPPVQPHPVNNEFPSQKDLILKLQTELASARTENAALLQEVQTLRPLAADLTSTLEKKEQTFTTILQGLGARYKTREAENAELIKKLAAAEKAKVDAEKDREFFREQYAQASGYVSQVRDENRALEQRIAVAEAQTQNGVNLVKATFEARVKALEDDLKAWRKMANFLIEKDRRSNNEEICRRAAEEPELRVQCARQLASLADAEERIDELDNLLDDKTREWSKSEAELMQYKRQVTQLHVDLAEAHTKLERIGRAGDIDDDSADPMGNGHEFVYSCKWRTGDQNESCREVFATLLELEEHLLSAEGHLEMC